MNIDLLFIKKKLSEKIMKENDNNKDYALYIDLAKTLKEHDIKNKKELLKRYAKRLKIKKLTEFY